MKAKHIVILSVSVICIFGLLDFFLFGSKSFYFFYASTTVVIYSIFIHFFFLLNIYNGVQQPTRNLKGLKAANIN